MRYKYQFFNLLQLRQIDRNELLLRADTVPNEVYCVISGEIQINSVLNQVLSKPITTTRTDPGKRIQLQQLDSTLGPHCTTITTGVNRMAIIGLEYPLL